MSLDMCGTRVTCPECRNVFEIDSAAGVREVEIGKPLYEGAVVEYSTVDVETPCCGSTVELAFPKNDRQT